MAQEFSTGAEFKYSVIDLSSGDATISSVPCLLRYIYVNTSMSAHEVTLTDNSGVVIRLPASTAAGSKVDFGDVRFETDMAIDVNASSTGEILVAYKPIQSGASKYPNL